MDSIPEMHRLVIRSALVLATQKGLGHVSSLRSRATTKVAGFQRWWNCPVLLRPGSAELGAISGDGIEDAVVQDELAAQ
jgi:hypothetical protein